VNFSNETALSLSTATSSSVLHFFVSLLSLSSFHLQHKAPISFLLAPSSRALRIRRRSSFSGSSSISSRLSFCFCRCCRRLLFFGPPLLLDTQGHPHKRPPVQARVLVSRDPQTRAGKVGLSHGSEAAKGGGDVVFPAVVVVIKSIASALSSLLLSFAVAGSDDQQLRGLSHLYRVVDPLVGDHQLGGGTGVVAYRQGERRGAQAERGSRGRRGAGTPSSAAAVADPGVEDPRPPDPNRRRRRRRRRGIRPPFPPSSPPTQSGRERVHPAKLAVADGRGGQGVPQRQRQRARSGRGRGLGRRERHQQRKTQALDDRCSVRVEEGHLVRQGGQRQDGGGLLLRQRGYVRERGQREALFFLFVFVEELLFVGGVKARFGRTRRRSGCRAPPPAVITFFFFERLFLLFFFFRLPLAEAGRRARGATAPPALFLFRGRGRSLSSSSAASAAAASPLALELLPAVVVFGGSGVDLLLKVLLLLFVFVVEKLLLLLLECFFLFRCGNTRARARAPAPPPPLLPPLPQLLLDRVPRDPRPGVLFVVAVAAVVFFYGLGCRPRRGSDALLRGDRRQGLSLALAAIERW